MNERESVLTPVQSDALKMIGPLASKKGFYLAGGIALALQVGHRRSRDFDYFTAGKIEDPLAFAREIQSSGIPFVVTRQARGTLYGAINGIETSFLEYPYAVIDRTILNAEFQTEMLTLRDIAAMKAHTLAERGFRRDFVDVFALLQSGVSIRDMVDAYEKKYGFDNTRTILLALNSSDNVEKHPMPEMLWPLKWPDVVKTIQKALMEFRRR